MIDQYTKCSTGKMSGDSPVLQFVADSMRFSVFHQNCSVVPHHREASLSQINKVVHAPSPCSAHKRKTVVVFCSCD